MAYVLIRFFHSSQDPIEHIFDSPQPSSPKYTGYTDSAHTLAAELKKKAAELKKEIGVILDATPKENVFEVTFIQPLCTIQATEEASSPTQATEEAPFPALFEPGQYSYQNKPLYEGIKNLPEAVGGELDNLKGSDGTFDLVYMKEIYDSKDNQEQGKPESKVITTLVNKIATLLKPWG